MAAPAQRWVTTRSDEAAQILTPCFDAVRDIFAEYAPQKGVTLEALGQTKMLVDPSLHDSPRHFAACRTDGKLIMLAPQMADLEPEQVAAILAHEFGHAADFRYPAHFRWHGRRAPALFKVPQRRVADKMRAWSDRSDDEVEWTADAIALSVTGKRIRYCGPCMVQCFSGGTVRPKGLK